MRNALSGQGLRNVRALLENGRHQPQSVASSVQLRRYANERAEDSSASNWGTGEPPMDEKMTERGVSRGQGAGMAQNTSTNTGTGQVGRHDEATSTSKFDTGEGSYASSSPSAGQPKKSTGQPKKSRTGGEMSDDGQVRTPHLGKVRSTREMLLDNERETEERLARTGTKPSN
ncbi:hypothetical protein R1sor_018960 [Riccia sorocarpa]|uniref:Uncharacterized protein n=1 Tax=Riccia sorocarpa TaxID=122646 RepID=A0ABD3IBA2_9MARC